MISFKAHRISDIDIKKSGVINRDFNVNFVELNPFYENDLETIKGVSAMWDDGKTLASRIYRGSETELIRGEPWHKFYGLVKQYDSFEKIQPENVLGLMDVCPLHERLQELNVIQVNPKDNLFSDCRRYLKVGTAMLDSLKALFPLKDILVEPLENPKVLKFYVKNGFKDIGDGLYKYIAKGKRV